MHITGVAFRGTFGAGQSTDPTTWSVPATVPFTIDYDVESPIGTATLTQTEDGSITVDVVIDEANRVDAEARPYLGVCLYGAQPTNTVMCAGLLAKTNDPHLQPWVEAP